MSHIVVKRFTLTALATTDMIKTNALFTGLFLALAVITGILFTSCTDSNAPSASQVPYDADYVSFINLTNNELTALLPEEVGDILNKVCESVDASSVMIYKPTDTRNAVVAAAVTDTDLLERILEECGMVKSKVSGVSVYESSKPHDYNPCIIIEGDCLWALGSKSDIEGWQNSLKQAKKKSFEEYGLDSLIAQKGDFLGFINPQFIGFSTHDTLIKAVIRADSKTLDATAELISTKNATNGAKIPFNGLQNISDLSFLNQMPSGSGLTIAAGITDAMNWSGIVEAVGSGLDTQNQGLLQALLPYMGNLQGTVAIGIGPITAKSLATDEIESQNLIIYASMKGNKAVDALNEINGNLKAKGLSPTPRADGIYAYTLGENRYRYTVRNGVFIFALNREIDCNTRNDSSLYAGKHMAAELRLPPLSTILPGCTSATAVNARLTLTDTAVNLIITNSGNDNPSKALGNYLKTVMSYRAQTINKE